MKTVIESETNGKKAVEIKDTARSKLVRANERIAEEVTGGYKKIQEGVVSGYKKIEDGAVEGFQKITDRFVENFLTKEGESLEEAKARLAAEEKERETDRKKAETAGFEARRKAGLK